MQAPRHGWIGGDGHRYFPGLDGLRCIAVTLVVLYHLGFSFAQGGYLGVDIFFVISGYLITSLLLSEKGRSGTVSLRAFWARRARRLLPALFLMLGVTSIVVFIQRAHIDVHTFRWDAIFTLLYAANWHEIAAHQSYFAQFAAPSPLAHTWSLAIEEQFYLLWPLVIVAVLALTARRARHRRSHPGDQIPRGQLLAVCAAMAALSAALMALAYHGQADTSTVYFATDTRAFELLVGAALAILLVSRPVPDRRQRRALEYGALSAGVLFAVIMVNAAGPTTLTTTGPAGWMYRGGFFVACVCAAAVIAAAARTVPGASARLLGMRPLRFIGRISYGVYLWHWPIIVFMTRSTTGLSPGWLDAARVAVTLCASLLSFYLVEIPLRRASFVHLRHQLLPVVATAGLAVVILAATVPVRTSVAGASGIRPSALQSEPTSAVSADPPYVPATPISLPPGRHPSAQDPLRVLLIGDSVMYTAVPALTADLQSTGTVTVTSIAFPGWGLTTSDNWQSVIPQKIAQYHPEVVMGTWSWDNDLARTQPAVFASMLNKLLSILVAPGNGVSGAIFLQFPPLGPLWSITPDANSKDAQRYAGVAAWDAQATTLARAHPGTVMYLGVGSSLEINGSFSPWLPAGTGTMERARMTDNTHLCPFGAALYASAVTSIVQSVFSLPPPSPGWTTGTWTTDNRYDTPPGSCPNDSPANPAQPG